MIFDESREKPRFIPQNIPVFERKSVSANLLRKYPQYAKIFRSCPSCGKYSLKPIGYKRMSPMEITKKDEKLERQCSLCGYVHKPIGIF